MAFKAPRFSVNISIDEIEEIEKGGLIVGDGSGAPAIVSVGSNDLPLVADSFQPEGVTWKALPIAGGGTGQTTQTAAMDALSPTTTKGDILVDNGTNVIRLPIGTDGQVLTADSGEASGLIWSTAAGGGGDVSGPVSSTNNAIVRWDGTGGNTVQNSGVTIDDSDNLSGVNNVTGSDTNFVTGTAGTNGNVPQWNADGDIVDGGVATSDIVTPSSTDTFTNKTLGGDLLMSSDGAHDIGTASVGTGDIHVGGTMGVIFNNNITIARDSGGTARLLFTGSAGGYRFDDQLQPTTNDGAELGSASLAWSDLFLASGAVVNFNNGDVTMTHSVNALDIDGGVVDFGSTPTVSGSDVYYTGGTDVAIADGGTGASTASAAFSNLKQAATTSATGVVELATSAEVTTGTDTSRAITPDALAGSEYGQRIIEIALVDNNTDTAVADGVGDIFWTVPEELDGWNIVNAHAAVGTAGTTGTTDVQIHNVTSAADVLSTKITIDSGETSSYTAATAPVINAAEDDLATGDQIRFDVDDVSTTAAKGLTVILTVQLP
jgi:hypothetical protein